MEWSQLMLSMLSPTSSEWMYSPTSSPEYSSQQGCEGNGWAANGQGAAPGQSGGAAGFSPLPSLEASSGRGTMPGSSGGAFTPSSLPGSSGDSAGISPLPGWGAGGCGAVPGPSGGMGTPPMLPGGIPPLPCYGGHGAMPGPCGGVMTPLQLPAGVGVVQLPVVVEQRQAMVYADLLQGSQRFPVQGGAQDSEGPSSGVDGTSWDTCSTCSTDFKSDVSTEAGLSPVRRANFLSMEVGSPAQVSTEAGLSPVRRANFLSMELGSPAQVEHADTDEEGMYEHASHYRERHWQGRCADTEWRLQKAVSRARMRATFGTVTMHQDFCHVAVQVAAYCIVCHKQSSGLWHAKACKICGWKRPQFLGKHGQAAVVKCGECDELAVGCKVIFQRCGCGKSAMDLLLRTTCPHMKVDVCVGCKPARTGLCNRVGCSFCHCASPERPHRRNPRHGARTRGGQAQQQPPTEWLMSVGAIFPGSR
eukprot:TRINITY_DN391_c0_g1_i1.p1 TRINITY_DN391_c0_g1~~TRINITY_DN391_c0_g1_i1.p1  ORF type:complete len:495 (-),score=65.29 TRINITY_DN391_c0_g1_i1:55-1479(-)